MPSKREIVQEWLEKGEHDFAIAKLGFTAGGPNDTIAVLIQQTAEKYLKGYLISRGWHLKKTHNLVELIDVACTYNPVFGSYGHFAERLTAIYIDERYPSGSPSGYSTSEIASLVQQAEKLMALVRQETETLP